MNSYDHALSGCRAWSGIIRKLEKACGKSSRNKWLHPGNEFDVQLIIAPCPTIESRSIDELAIPTPDRPVQQRYLDYMLCPLSDIRAAFVYRFQGNSPTLA